MKNSRYGKNDRSGSKGNFDKKSSRSHQAGGDFSKSKGQSPNFKNPKRLDKEYPRSWRQVTGTHAVMELINTHPKSVELVLLQQNWRSSAELRGLAERITELKIKTEDKSEAQLSEISRSHQGAVAFSNLNLEFDVESMGWEDNGLVLALDGVEDTQNLGAVLRTSWLMGVNGIVIPEDRAVGLTATVHKVACGGAEHVPICRTNKFSEPFDSLKKAGFWVFGLSHKAQKSIYDLDIPEKVIWVLGSEDKGMRTTTEKVCDELVSIPQSSPGASYNVSVSAALALGETKRQWLNKKKSRGR